MRPTLYAIVVALVLVTSALLMVVTNTSRVHVAPGAGATGLRTAAIPNYFVSATTKANPVLAGYPDTVFYQVLNNTNHAPVAQLSSVTILGHYYNHALTLLTFPSTPAHLPTSAVGNWSFTVPPDASNAFGFSPVLTIWANSTSLSMNTSTSITIFVGALTFDSSSVCDQVTNVCGGLVSTDPAIVTVRAVISAAGFGFVAAPNEALKLTYYSTGSSPVTVPGVPLTLTTDYQGWAHETFFPNSTIFNVPGPDHTELELIDAVNASATVFTNVTWNDHNPSGNAEFAFWLNSPQYFGGDKVTASWQWRGTNATVGAITMYDYFAIDLSTGAVLASATLASVANSGSFTFALPATYYGNFEVTASAYNSSTYWNLLANGFAYQPTIFLNPSEVYYNPGDTITMSVVTQGSIFSSATITAIAEAADSGQQLFHGVVSGSQFQFTIPTTAPAAAYHVLAWASTPAAGTFASFEGTISEASGYSFWAGVSTQSMYSDGSFAPGQTVQLSYKLTTYGTTTLPREIEVLIFPVSLFGGSTPALKIWLALSTSGTVSFTIPSNTPNGLQTYFVEATWPSLGAGIDEALISMNINSAPSALNYELGAGSGVTVGWLILLILLVVVVIVLIAMMRKRGGRGAMMMSPAAASSTPPVSDWKEPPTSGTSGGSSTPPTAPPGAQ